MRQVTRPILCGAVLAIAVALPASAETKVEAITRQLMEQGYSEIEVSRTFLRRIQIEAKKGNAEREIIINPRSGEILRDYWEHEDNDDESGILGDRDD